MDEKQENISLKIATIEEANRELTARIKDLEKKKIVPRGILPKGEHSV